MITWLNILVRWRRIVEILDVFEIFREQRRHSFGIGLTPKSPTITSGSLPHVRLNKTRRSSLSERNSSMMNKSSTVKIAPPVIGKVASPSLYHMRCNTTTQEERNTPDTYAVISALKERRKRSINTFEEHIEPPQQQAKRRRQESQHSNASTSSMPSMPENFPDLTNTNFTMRLDTPSLKRPSRPSQEDTEEWNKLNHSKRQHYEGRNNSILSSLSSSQRFIEKSKRKAESSFTEKENTSYVTKSQRTEPPKLTHIDIQYNTDNSIRTPNVPKVTEKLTNGHSEITSQVDMEKTKQSQKKEELEKPAVPKLPSMKKTASVYSGLSSPASFKKAQYANVVATLDDYDADKEAENQRVKQMLKDLDESFTKKEAKKESLVASTATESTITTTVSTVTATSVSITTTTTGPLKLNVTKPESVLTALEKLSKSPVQETGGAANTSVSTSQPSMTFKPLFGTPSTTSASGASSLTGLLSTTVAGTVSAANSGVSGTSQPATMTGTQSSLPGGFSFNAPKSTQSTGANLTTATTVSSVNSLGGQKLQDTGIGIAFASATTTTAASSSTKPSAVSGFTFGIATASTSASSTTGGFTFGGSQSTISSTPAVTTTAAATTAGFSFASITSSSKTQAPAGVGFTFNTCSAPTSTTSAAGFSFSSQPTTSVPASAGFSFGIAGSSAPPSTGGFSFGGQTTAAVTTVVASQFGTATTTSATPAFNFGNAQNTAGSNAATAPSTGFTFGAPSNSTQQSATSIFGTPAVCHTQTPFGASVSTTQTAFGAPASTTQTPFGAPASTTQAPFGAPASTTQTPFGAQASTTQAPFGAPASTTQTPFGAPGSTTQTPFGAPGSTTQTPFGAPVSNAQTPFGASTTTQTPFGASTGNATTGFSFGIAKTTASASPFSFNAGSTASTAGSTPFNFGRTATTHAILFGAPTTQASTFGTSQTPAFGTTGQTPAFGATSQTPAFGSTNQTPAFGSTNQTPAFGATNQTPAFGSAAPSFGASANQKPSTPVFGATANNSNGSVFGSSTGTGFAKSHSMPAFATNQDTTSNTGTFNFGGPAPNVNPFGQGQTTPAKQTGAAFGQVSNDQTPKAQTGAMFNFGQTNNNSAVKGFDFSASTGPSTGQTGTGGFNFMASASVPVFNFGSTGATPSFGAQSSTPGSFSVGAGSAAPPRPRVMARAQRRRPTRK